MKRTVRSLIWSSVYAVAVLVFIAMNHPTRHMLYYLSVFYVTWTITGLIALTVRVFLHRIICEYKICFVSTRKVNTYEDYKKYLYWKAGVPELMVMAFAIPIRIPILVTSLLFKSSYVDNLLFPEYYGEYSNYEQIKKFTSYVESTYGVTLEEGWIYKR